MQNIYAHLHHFLYCIKIQNSIYSKVQAVIHYDHSSLSPRTILTRSTKENLTGSYEFEFTRIITPYENDKFIEIRQHDDMTGYDIRSLDGRWCYYVAEATYKPDWT